MANPFKYIELEDDQPQLRLIYKDGTRTKVSQLETDSAGHLNITPSGGRARVVGRLGVGVAPSNAQLEVFADAGEIFRADAAAGAYRLIVDQAGVNLNGLVDLGGDMEVSGAAGLGVSPTASVRLHAVGPAGGVAGLFANADTTNGFGLKVTAGGNAAGRYALNVLDAADSTSFLKIRTDSGAVGDVEVGAGRLGVGVSPSFPFHLEKPSAGDIVARMTNTSATNPYVLNLITSAAAKDDNSTYFLACDDSVTRRAIIYSDGDLVNHDNSYGAISDALLKQDIVDADLQSQWDDIRAMKLRRYRHRSDVEALGEDAPMHLGLIAQELQTVSPGLVRYDRSRDELSVQYSLVPLKLLGVTQLMMDRLESLESRLDAGGL